MMWGLSVEDAMQYLSPVAESHGFWLKDGKLLLSLEELLKALDRMDEATFTHHVTPQRNDFARWVADVFKDNHLAKKLRYATSLEQMRSHVKERVEELKTVVQKKSPQAELPKAAPQEERIGNWMASQERMLDQVNKILDREKEIAVREQKIQEGEERIEQLLEQAKRNPSFVKTFIQGMLVGILLTVGAALAYILLL